MFVYVLEFVLHHWYSPLVITKEISMKIKSEFIKQYHTHICTDINSYYNTFKYIIYIYHIYTTEHSWFVLNYIYVWYICAYVSS